MQNVGTRAAMAAVSVLLWVAGVAGQDGGAEDRAAIAAASRDFSAAYVANDSAAIAAVYCAEAVLLPPGREIRGRAGAALYFRWGPPYRQLAHAMASSELTIDGDMAIDVGTWRSTGQRGDQEPDTAEGRYLVVWVREADGQWRIRYDMWHRPEAPAAPRSAAPRDDLVPAYAHNDYGNRHPLQDALDQGYRGVEADFYLVEGELRVAHDRDETRPGRTLESLYLDPLRALVARDGSVLPDGSTFLLNIEAKEKGRETYDALCRVLARYPDLLTVVRDGVAEPGPVQVVLVGWFPPLAELAAEPVRRVAVQAHYRQLPKDQAALPADLLKLVTVKYTDEFDWDGHGQPPPEFTRHLARIRAAADAVPGRLLRVFQVPRRGDCYAALLEGGVDLIGTKTLGRSRKLLLDCLEVPR